MSFLQNNAATLKVAHSQPGENHTVKFEDKLDGTSKDLGGMKMEVKATNDGKIAFDNQLTGLFKVSNQNSPLTYFHSFFLSFRMLKVSKTLLYIPVVKFLLKVDLIGLQDSVTMVKIINSKLKLMLKRIQTSTLKLFGDHANGLLLQRKLDLIPLSKTPILNLHQPLLSQEQLDFNLDKFYQVFTTVVKAFLT